MTHLSLTNSWDAHLDEQIIHIFCSDCRVLSKLFSVYIVWK